MDKSEIKNIVQAVIQASRREPVMLEELCRVFLDYKEVETADIQEAIAALLKADDAIQELRAIAGGYRYNIRQKYTPWIQKFQNPDNEVELLPRVLVETLAIIAYKQPVSRGEVELIRGKQTSVLVYQQLEERGWVKIVAYGGESKRAALYGTTLEFLAYFNLNSIEDLPDLEEKMALEATAL